MTLIRKFFFRKPPDRLLEISERVYVFDCCFSTDVLEEDEYKDYMRGIVAQLQDYFPDASFMAVNFREGERSRQISDILSQYGMTVMDYPWQYEGCPLLPLEMIHHFMRSSESWLSLEGQQNVLLMHCERGGWPVLTFMLAGLLLYRKQYNGELETLEMVNKQAPKELLHLLTPLNPQPSQLRYLQYISRRNLGVDWPPSYTPLALDCIILRDLPLFDGGKGCRPVVRVYGQDPSTRADRRSKLLFSTPKTKRHVHHYLQSECMLVKIDIHCRVQGDIVLECINLGEDLVREEMMLRVMFHTTFVRSNVLLLNRDEIDVLWDAKDQFPKDFRAEVLFSNFNVVGPIHTSVLASEDESETEMASPEEFFEVEESFSNIIDVQEGKADDNHTIQRNSSDDGNQKEIWKEDPHAFEECTLDDGNHKHDVIVDPAHHEIKDIVVDVMHEKKDWKIDPDLNGVKDIVLDHQENELDSMDVVADELRNIENKAVTKDMRIKLEEDENKHHREDSATQKLESKVSVQNLSSDFGRQKSEKLLLPPPRKPTTFKTKASANSVVAKQKTKQQELLNTSAKATKPKATISRWIPPNKGSYTNSMHVEYPASRYNSAPPVPAVTTLKKDPNVGFNPKARFVTGATKSAHQKTDLHEARKDGVDLEKHLDPTLETFTPASPSSLPLVQVAFPSSQPPSPPPCPVLEKVVSQASQPPPCPPPPPFSSNPSLYDSSPFASSLQVRLTLPHSPLLPPPPSPPSRNAPFVTYPPSLPPTLSTGKKIGTALPPPPPWKPLCSSNPPPPPPLPYLNASITSKLDGATLSPPLPPSPPPPSPMYGTPPPPPLPPMQRVPSAPPPPPLPMSGAPPLPPQPPLSGVPSSMYESPPPRTSPMHGAPPPPPPPMPRVPPPPPMCGASQPPPPPVCGAPPPPVRAAPPPMHGAPPPPPPIRGGPAPPPPPTGAVQPRPPGGAPPLPPPFGARPADTRSLLSGRGRELSCPSMAATTPRRSSLKPLHWSKVTRALQGSLWEELQRYGEPQMAPEFDVSEIESLFAATVPNSDKSGGRRKSDGSKTDKVHLVDLRRANNTEIMLTKVKMPLSDMMAAVLAMDASILDFDQVENLIKFCPTKEEMELLKGYTGDKDNLGKCEQFFLELMKVPRVESKLRVFSFKIQFGSQITDFKKSLNTVNSACEEVRNSLKLKEIMKKILFLGNTLNQGTARGSAVGFKLDSLLKLTDTRASNSKMTLMHYLCKVLAAKSPALLDFHQDLVSLESASRIQLTSLAEEMQSIIKGMEKLKHELGASENDGPVSKVFRETLKEFVGVAEIEVATVTNLYSVAGRNADALALYFGEDPARCPFEQVIAMFLNFVRMFRRVHEENCKQAELEKKKADKEAEMEKVKGVNLTKKSVK